MSRLTTFARPFLCAVVLLFAVPFLARAQSTPAPPAISPAQLDEILSSQNRARTFTQVAVSPDGLRVAWLQAGQIRFAPIDNLLQNQEITAPGQSCIASEFVWSPNSAS